MKKAITALLVLMLIASILAACGGNGSGSGGGSTGLTGKYNLVSITEGGDTMDASQLAEFGLDIDEFYLEFLDGRKFKMVTFGETQDGTYKLDGKALTLTVDGEPASATIDGNKIVLDADGTEMVFEKK